MMSATHVLMTVHGHTCAEKKNDFKNGEKKTHKRILLLNMELNNVIIRL